MKKKENKYLLNCKGLKKRRSKEKEKKYNFRKSEDTLLEEGGVERREK